MTTPAIPDVTQLRELLAKAVPPPWRFVDMGLCVMCDNKDFRGGIQMQPGPFKIVDIRGWGFLQYRDDAEERSAATGELIAAAINALPALLDELEAAREVVKAADAVRKQMIADDYGGGVGGLRWSLMQTIAAYDRAIAGQQQQEGTSNA